MSYSFILTLVILSAENNALRMAAAQPTGLPSIPRPEKGTAGNGFNLCAAMELEDDPILYGAVRVSQFFSIFLSLL